MHPNLSLLLVAFCVESKGELYLIFQRGTLFNLRVHSPHLIILIMFSISNVAERNLFAKRKSVTKESQDGVHNLLWYHTHVAVGGRCVHLYHRECVHRWWHEQMPYAPTCPTAMSRQ
jgi:hypothetical protein